VERCPQFIVRGSLFRAELAFIGFVGKFIEERLRLRVSPFVRDPPSGLWRQTFGKVIEYSIENAASGGYCHADTVPQGRFRSEDVFLSGTHDGKRALGE
jgi:hypothetical protein